MPTVSKEALQSFLRTINALILREINSRYGGSRLGYLWALVNPVISIGVLYLIYSTIGRNVGDFSLLIFLITGWFTYGFYQSMCQSVASGEAANRSLLMHRPVTRLDVMISRAVLDTLTSISFFLLAFGIAVLLESATPPDDLLLVMVSYLAAGFFGASLGVLVGAIMTYFPFALNFLMPVNRLGFFISGTLFTAAMLPSWTYDYLKFNPLIHATEGVRQGWVDSYQSPILDLSYTCSLAAIFLILGLYLERRTRRGIKI